ncbi:MAG: hypothetical protein US76_03405 [Parcubacteria group bacterium GW2011_GWA2_38_13b]|nr:MAG: hypothetical protein US76_03405 [Parcubacteria group bacterium GW2011_GWA2_38_13b]
MTINNFIKQRPYLVWYVKDIERLSQESIVEHTLNDGDFGDIKELISILGVKKVADIFKKQLKQKRINYDSKIINYFKLYFKQYA